MDRPARHSLLAAHPRIGKAMRGAFNEIMFAPGVLDRTEREMVAAVASATLEMTAADWQPLRDLGFDDEGLLEVGHLIAIFNYFPRMADGFGLKPDPQTRQAAATGVPLRRPT